MLLFAFGADPNSKSTFHLDVYRDPTFNFVADPNPAPHLMDENLRSPVSRPCMPPLWASTALYGYILSLHNSLILTLKRAQINMTWIFADLDPRHCYRQRSPNRTATSIRSTVGPSRSPFPLGIWEIYNPYHQCSGSIYFWASRIRIHLSEVRIRILPSTSENSKKIFISFVLWLLYYFLSLKIGVFVPTKSNKQNKLEKIIFVGILKVTDEKSRIRIRIKMSQIRNTAYRYHLHCRWRESINVCSHCLYRPDSKKKVH